jgi:hypothetical protein
VKWKDLNEIAEFRRRGSREEDTSEEEVEPLKRRHSRDYSREERRRDRGRERETFPRPKLVQARTSSHEDPGRRDRQRDRDRDSGRERDRDWDRVRDRESRGTDRKRERGQRKFVSPVTGVDGRKYPPAGWR